MESPDSLHGILDLRPLAVPPDHGGAAWLVVVALLVLLGLLLAGWRLWTRLQSPRSRAARQLRQIQRGSVPVGGDAAQARRLAKVLAGGIGSHHLGTSLPLPPALGEQQARWQRFITRLSQVGYAGRDSDHQTNKLATEARYWLRQWPRGSDPQ